MLLSTPLCLVYFCNPNLCTCESTLISFLIYTDDDAYYCPRDSSLLTSYQGQKV